MDLLGSTVHNHAETPYVTKILPVIWVITSVPAELTR